MPLDQFKKVSQMLFLFAHKLSELALKNWQQEQMIAEIQRARLELAKTNALLERKVEERTEQLTAMNEELIAMNQELQDINRTLATRNERLREEISARQKAQTELANSLEKLRSTQEQLIQQDKLAALGNLVAGIAHEINTPVGVALTAASYLAGEGQRMNSLFETGTLRRQDFKTFNSEINESTELLISNLERASDLVRSVKQLAVDQANEEKREFFVGKYLQQTMGSLLASAKSKQLDVVIDCSAEIKIVSWPGLISQILTNLFLNSVHHAYDQHKAGRIHIGVVNAAPQRGWLTIRYEDDGKGMTPEIRRRIFEPFYTTKRGKGGSGLGMYIVYSLVQKLKGRIECQSEAEQGTTFLIELPTN